MTTSDVSAILQRLSVIETKIDGQQGSEVDRKEDRRRITRLEIVLAVTLGSWGVDALNIPTPFTGG